MSNFFDDYLKLNPVEDKVKDKPNEDEPINEESEEDDE